MANINIKYTVYLTVKVQSGISFAPLSVASQIRPRRSSYEDLNSVLGCNVILNLFKDLDQDDKMAIITRFACYFRQDVQDKQDMVRQAYDDNNVSP